MKDEKEAARMRLMRVRRAASQWKGTEQSGLRDLAVVITKENPFFKKYGEALEAYRAL